MDFLIKSYWYQAEADRLGIKVTDAQVQQVFNTDKKQQFPTAAAFNQFLTQSGQTMEDILYRVRVNEIFKKLLAKHQTTVTAAAIAAYYRATPRQFGSPETRDIRIVRTTTAKQAAAAKAALDSGQSWKAVAKKYSIDTVHQEQRRPAGRRHQGRGGAGARHRRLLGAGEQDPGRDPWPVRLLRVRGDEDQALDPADARSGDAADQADPQRPVAEHRAGRGRQAGKGQLAEEDQVPHPLRDGRLHRLQGAEDLDHVCAADRATDRAPTTTAPPATTTATTSSTSSKK